MNNTDPEIEEMLAKPEFLADPVFSGGCYLTQVTYAMMGRFIRATEQPKDLVERVVQKHVDENSACAMTEIPGGTGIFVVWAFDLDKQGPHGQLGRTLFIERAKRSEVNLAATSSPQLCEKVMVRGVLRIQADSPEHRPGTSKDYHVCQLKNVGWYVAGLGPSGKLAALARPLAPMPPVNTPQAVSQGQPGKIQIREDARAFREFYPDATQRHKVHYGFAHQFLPQYVRQNPGAFFNYTFPTNPRHVMDSTRFIQSRWMMFEERAGLFKQENDIFGMGMVFRRVTDLGMNALKAENRSIALVRMPPPEQHVEAYFVAVVFPDTRIFTLEATLARHSGLMATGVICEWTQAGQHNNLAIAVPPDSKAFLEAIMEILRRPPASVVAAFKPGTSETLGTVTVGNISRVRAYDPFGQGMEASKALRWDEALTHFDHVLHDNPNHAEAWFRKGQALLALQRFPDALVSLEKAVELGQKEAIHLLNYWRRKLCG